MTVTDSAVFTFKNFKSDPKRDFARMYYEVTVFNRKENKTAKIEVPYNQYEHIDYFIEDCLYAELSMTEHCEITAQPKTVDLLKMRKFYQDQIQILNSIDLTIDDLFNELFFTKHAHSFMEGRDGE